MKRIPYYLVVFLTLFFVSCSNESIEEIINEEIVDPNPEPDPDPDQSTDPCDFDLSGLAANSTVVMDCVLDLEGKTIDLPANVNFDYQGGAIINGTLKFSGGYIAGPLLNSELGIQGDARLKETTFKFIPAKWKNIVQGQTSSAIALENTANLEELMFFTKELGATTFEIDQFDAYFETTKVTSTTTNQNFYASLEAVNIPSDFTLQMSNNTYLRQFPAVAGIENGTILAVRDVSNVKVIGGNLVGDRNERPYSANDVGLEGTHLFHVHSGRNITIDGVNFIEGSKGAIAIYSFGFSFNPDYKPTTGVDIINCTFKDIRRMGIALTDGRNILIEGNTFTNVGQSMPGSDGGEVGYAINVEAYRTRDAQGNLRENERAFDIDIRKNTETNSRVGFVSVHIGQTVTVEDNDVGTRVVFSLTNGTKILRNRFKASSSNEDFAIFAAGSGETVYNNEVGYNEISGYGLGIAAKTKDVEVHHNTITNSDIGIQVNNTIDSQFHDNTINVSNNGISATSTYANNVAFVNNQITAGGFHAKFSLLNKNAGQENYRVTLEGNKFLNNKRVNFFNTNGVIFKNNEVNGGLEIGDATSNIEISATNKITPSNSDGIRIYGSHTAISIANNIIAEPTGEARFQCINNDSNTPGAITLANNTCN
ncbi:hypothetical protein [Aquimarina sp. MMG016]|uniref:hypothetical protein n=1 Tax=Aquimarina sp. MMG016 TaxID=2822690 RepID=UPI001B39FFE3|nr:hypothetical protein [Aquimarina sp. MMG016]MBQ4819558.1 hypothetical protein [Aquimarina sp. MMG016]